MAEDNADLARAESPCGGRLVAVDCAQHVQDVVPLDVSQQAAIAAGRLLSQTRPQDIGKITNVDGRAATEDERPLDDVFELANVTGPGMPTQQFHRLR